MSDKIKNRIDKLSKEDMLSTWESNFLDSLMQWVSKGHRLSQRQNSTLQKIESKYSADRKASLLAWKESFTEDMHDNMRIMAHYYFNNPPYFGDLVDEVLTNEKYIPSEAAYRAMCENKYAVRVIANVKENPLYEVGSIALVRANAHGKAAVFKNKMVMILEHDTTKVISPAKDARPVHVIPVGSSQSFWTEERYLKKVKKTG